MASHSRQTQPCHLCGKPTTSVCCCCGRSVCYEGCSTIELMDMTLQTDGNFCNACWDDMEQAIRDKEEKMRQEQATELAVPQRFHAYDGMVDNYPCCDAPACEEDATWFDPQYVTFWCDVHVRQEVAVLPRVRCEVCYGWYLPSKVRDGVCSTCPRPNVADA